MKLDKNTIINKFMQLETSAHRGSKLVGAKTAIEDVDIGKLLMVLHWIRKDLEDLELMVGNE